MSARGLTTSRRQPSNEGGGHGAAPIVASLLALCAAPTFATMALFSIVSQSGAGNCMAQGASPLSGMTAMYLLMSAFHLAPWLKRIDRRL